MYRCATCKQQTAELWICKIFVAKLLLLVLFQMRAVLFQALDLIRGVATLQTVDH